MKMTISQLAAFDALLEACRKDVAIDALQLFYGVDAAQEEAFYALAQQKADSGLTADDARKVRAFLTEHGQRVLDTLIRLVGEAHAVELLTWLKAEVKAAPVVDPPGPATPASAIFCTDFLRGWPNEYCPLFGLSDATPEHIALNVIRQLAADGYTAYTPYLFDAGDGDGKHHVDVLSNLTQAERRLQAALNAGLQVWPFIYSDAPGHVDPARAARAVELLAKYFTGICVSLEPGDMKNDALVRKVAAAVGAVTNLPLGIHTDPVGGSADMDKVLRFARDPWCRFVWVQYWNPAKPGTAPQIMSLTRQVMDKLPGVAVIPGEYGFNRQALGDAAIQAGGRGALNGCGPGGRKLLSPLVFADAPSPAPTGHPADEVSLVGSKAYYKGRDLGSYTGLPVTRKMKSASISGDKVRFAYESLTGWHKDDDLDAHICIVFDAGGELIASRFDHKRVGQTVKELKNIDEKIISRDGRAFVPASGTPVGFFLVSHDEKQRTNTVAGGKYP